jgi:hypothetical protein
MEYIAWPLAAVICIVIFMLIFRPQIADLIQRMRRVGYGNRSIDIAGTPTAVEQQKHSEAPSTTESPIGATPAEHALPPPNPIYEPAEKSIRSALDSTSGISAEVKTALLIRAVAVARMERAHESNYRMILGSQLDLLLEANSTNPPNVSRAREIYERTKSAFPSAYVTFPFEVWLNWPLSVKLLTRIPAPDGNDLLRITSEGQDFLHYLVTNGLTRAKAF